MQTAFITDKTEPRVLRKLSGSQMVPGGRANPSKMSPTENFHLPVREPGASKCSHADGYQEEEHKQLT